MRATSAQSQEIGDVDGHAASLARFSGLPTFPDDTVGTTYFIAATDYTKGAGIFREVMHATSVQAQEVGDVEGHVPALVRFSGLALFPDGAVGTTYFVGATDYTKGTGPYSAYHNVTFAGGAVLWLKWVGTTTAEGTISLVKGTVSVIGGEGRFEGAKGDGTVTGTRLTPLVAGADLYLDLVINVKNRTCWPPKNGASRRPSPTGAAIQPSG
jgi:hypothetical protein